jgi:hypothetical protein
LEFLGLRGNLRGIEAGGNEFQDAREGEVVADDLGEETGVGAGVGGTRGEIGDGDAGFLDAEAGAGAEPVLAEGGGGEEKAESDCREKEQDGLLYGQMGLPE